MTLPAKTPSGPFKKASPRKPIRVLDDRGERLVELMTLGLSEEEAADYPGLPAHEALDLEQAARVIGLKLKNARFIFASQPFLKAYSQNLAAVRNGHKARAIGVLAEIMCNPGDGLAADRAVQIKAATALLNDSEGKGGGTNIAVQVNNAAMQLQPGVVVRLPATAAIPPLERQHGKEEDDTDIIDITPAGTDGDGDADD